jgi:hypothetical protein
LPKGKPLARHREKISTHVALVSENGKAEKRKANPSPAANADQVKVRNELQSRWQAEKEELKLKKGQIENGIKNSTGAQREQWKYRLAVWEEKRRTAQQQEAAARDVPK